VRRCRGNGEENNQEKKGIRSLEKMCYVPTNKREEKTVYGLRQKGKRRKNTGGK